MGEEKHETIHVHNKFLKPNYYIFALFIPSIIFVFVLAFIYKGKSNISSNEIATSSTQVQAMKEEERFLTIDNRVELEVKVAKSEVEQARGLSGKTDLGEYEGMLFVFSKENIRPSFWMKDMFIAIDIIWINDGEIVQINANAEPEPGVMDNKLKRYIPNQPIDYVLEVNAGFCERNGIEVGNSIDLSKVL